MSAVAEVPSVDIRQRILQAARAAFMEEGYRASMERIAARAGVAKQTLYNHFPSKPELFAAVARANADTLLVSLAPSGASLRQQLVVFSRATRNLALGEESLSMCRALVGEAQRFPELVAAYYAAGPCEVIVRLTAVLGAAMAKGQLREDDPAFAADMFLGMLLGRERNDRLFGGPPLDPALEADRVERIVDCFLRAYAPQKTSGETP